ncbi:MAG: hypothetical protein ACRDRJ_49400 [Streptosporangiaceae bacterium]
MGARACRIPGRYRQPGPAGRARPGERIQGAIEDGVHIRLGQLGDRGGELDPARPVVV